MVLVSALDSYQGSLQYYTTTEPRIVRRKKMKLKRRNIGTMRWKRWVRGVGPQNPKVFQRVAKHGWKQFFKCISTTFPRGAHFVQ